MTSFIKNLFGKKKETPPTQTINKDKIEEDVKNQTNLASNDIDSNYPKVNFSTEPNLHDNFKIEDQNQKNKIENMTENINMSESNYYSNQNNQESTTNKKSFAFLKNKKSANEGVSNNPSNTRISLPEFSSNSNYIHDANFHEEKNISQASANNVTVNTNNPPSKEIKAGFAFLKNKKNNQNSEENNLKNKQDEQMKKTDEYNLQLQNILNDENLFNVISSNMQEANKLNEEKIRENEMNNSSNIEQQANHSESIHSNTETKNKNFNFIKKKNTINSNVNNNILDKENESQKNNLEEINNVNNISNNDINSDTKSFKSLKINNNFKNENISVILDAGNDDDINKSVITENTNSNNLGSKGGFKFLKNKDAGKETNPTSSNVNKLGFLKKHQEKDREDENSNKFIKENKTEENVNLSPAELKVKCYSEFLKGNEIVRDLYIKFHTLKKIRFFKEKEKIELKSELDHLTNLENLAIENNDFDEAQLIENKIIEIKNKLDKIDSDKDTFNNELLELRNQELKILKDKEKLLDETSKKLTKLKTKQEKEIENFNNNELAKHKNDNIKIKKLVEKLQFLQTDLEEKKSYIDEEEEKINKVIKSQSVEIFEELDKLKINKDSIQKEIEELESILAKKYSELDVVCKQIENKEGEIDEIKSTFSHEFNKINSKKKNYEEKLKDYNDQNITLEQMKNSYNENQIKIDNKITEMNNFISEIEKEISNMKNIISNIDCELNKRDNLLKNENAIDAKIKIVDLNLHKLKEKKINEENEINNLDVSVKKLETELISIDIKIPSLEEEKKTYVASKNFKEAGRVSNELKLLNETKVKSLELIKINKETINGLKEEISLDEKEIENIENSKNEFFVEKNINKYEYLICYQKQLKEFIEDFVSKSEFANVDKERNGFYSEHVYVLNEELEYVNDEISKLEALDYIQERFEINKEISNQEISESINYNNEENNNKENETHDENKEDNKVEEIENKEEENIQIEEATLPENENKENDEVNENQAKEETYNYEELSMRFSELEKELEMCVEREDYEQADLIQTQINEINEVLKKMNK